MRFKNRHDGQTETSGHSGLNVIALSAQCEPSVMLQLPTHTADFTCTVGALHFLQIPRLLFSLDIRCASSDGTSHFIVFPMLAQCYHACLCQPGGHWAGAGGYADPLTQWRAPGKPLPLWSSLAYRWAWEGWEGGRMRWGRVGWWSHGQAGLGSGWSVDPDVRLDPNSHSWADRTPRTPSSSRAQRPDSGVLGPCTSQDLLGG